MLKKRLVGGLAAVFMLSGCYHQVVDTGVAAGTKSIERPWTSTWIFGLVEAKPIDVRSECPAGVAIVDTKMSFMNGLLGGLTLGIWTPLSVTVRCAGSTAALPANARIMRVNGESVATVGASLDDAVKIATSERTPVVLDWRASTVSTLSR